MTVAAEHLCAPYRSDEYAYPQAGEDDIIQRLGGLFSPYMGEVFDSKGDTDIEHVAVAPFLFKKTRHTWDTTKNFSPSIAKHHRRRRPRRAEIKAKHRSLASLWHFSRQHPFPIVRGNQL